MPISPAISWFGPIDNNTFLRKFKFRVLGSGLVPSVVTAGIPSGLKIAHQLIAFDVDISKN